MKGSNSSTNRNNNGNDTSIEVALPAVEEMQLNVPLKIPGLVSSDTYLNIDNKEKKTIKKKKKKKKRKGKKGIINEK